MASLSPTLSHKWAREKGGAPFGRFGYGWYGLGSWLDRKLDDQIKLLVVTGDTQRQPGARRLPANDADRFTTA
jgi:hypothetical protein